jgi:hypothetical protein
MTQPANTDLPDPTGEEDDEDCYFDGPYLVFTEAYHLKRGYCCESGCRHCPYGYGKNNVDTGSSQDQGQKNQGC